MTNTANGICASVIAGTNPKGACTTTCGPAGACQ
jgi:hypothetical protein